MIETATKYIKHTKFQLLENWSVQYLIESIFLYNPIYKLAKIGDFLIRSRNQVEIENGKSYQRVTIKINNGGVIPRDIEIGERIGTKLQYRISEGQFLMSKIDARNGAFGIVPKELEGAVVTNDFPAFNVNRKVINPEFLVLITTTKEFVKFAQSCSSGTTNRQRIDVAAFLNVKIPLPTLEEQNQIVAAFNKRIVEAERLENEAKQLEKGIEEYVFNELGVEKFDSNIQNSKFFNIKYSEISRWDVWVGIGGARSKKYKNTTLEEVVIGKPQYGANVKGVKVLSDTRYIRITDINESGDLNDEFVSPASIDSKFLLKENDFLIARSGNTVGKTLLYKREFGKAIFAGYLVKYNIDFSLILPEYLLLFSKSYSFRKWIETNQRISGQPNINGQEFLRAPLIIPPIMIQKEIALTVEKTKKKIKELKQQAISDKSCAITEFESKIFMPCN